ncbi:ribosomal protein S18-alanine N-acetyltransferase [Pseudanabaena sp. FACHB-1277]|jgi:ribosomal-protein-alanine N-acetyltransferase|uniref:Ribosomal protein S18-alanine N-acetyltransferase n=1 Tax=Pseudanabaena cinerea FACHB-1277 TaxID=2949581 RepID=A0A926UW60_9CYAN|nr:ribosomal protein S18-alanine N-acetyltransferase [Pseudanabaena cinerea]MBD2152327.1 ribosomal protein S18-alanine N-acetyltransferase [Pseudanabaena cinerea FACHB-1277]
MNSSHPIYLNEIDNSFLSQLRAIDRDCLNDFWSLEAYQREIDNPSSCVLGLVNDSHELLGFGCLWSILEEAHITVLAVRPEYQGQGLGKAILWGLLGQARDRQLEWATLEVRNTNAAAIALYQSFDFQAIGCRVNYYEATGEDALIFWRKGIHQPEFADLLQNWYANIHQRLLSKGWDWQSKIW